MSSWFKAAEFSAAAQEVLASAGRLARGAPPGARHVACALFCEQELGAHIATVAGADLGALQAELRSLAAQPAAQHADDPDLLLRCCRAQRPSFGPKNLEDLALALFEKALGLPELFARHGLTPSGLQAALPSMEGNAAPSWGHALEERGRARREEEEPREPRQSPGVSASKLLQAAGGKAAEEAKPSVLPSCAVDLVQEARAGRLDPVVGRDAEVARALQILARRSKNNVCLVGPPGVGKTALAEALAQRLAKGDVPRPLAKCKELWALDVASLVAGTGLRGDFEERLQALLRELRSGNGSRMLFVDELHLLLGAGRSENNSVDAANLMKPMLARGEIRCVGATTTDEYKRLVLGRDAAFERRFQPLELKEPEPPRALEMLQGLQAAYEAHHSVAIEEGAVRAAVELSHREIRGRSLPDKAIDVLDEACCLATAQGAREVTAEHAAAVVRRWRPPPWQRRAAGGGLRNSLAGLFGRSRL